MDKREAVEILTKYKIVVSKYFDLDKMVLFGSYARGNQKDESDIDVAIVVNSINGDFFTYAPLLWKLRRDIDERIEPILIDNNHDESGFLKEVLNYGVVI